MLHYDEEGVAVVTDSASGEVTWRAGEEGQPAVGVLLLGGRGAVQVELPAEHVMIWRSAIAAAGARELTLTDEGDPVLLDSEGATIFDSRTGPFEPRTVPDSAPAARRDTETESAEDFSGWMDELIDYDGKTIAPLSSATSHPTRRCATWAPSLNVLLAAPGANCWHRPKSKTSALTTSWWRPSRWARTVCS